MEANNIQLYEKIMRNISKEIKRILNEYIQNFDIGDYQEDETDIINHQDINSVTIKRDAPKNLEEEKDTFYKTIVSNKSKSIADKFLQKIESIFEPIKNKKLSKRVLDENSSYQLNGWFSIDSNFEDERVVFEYAFFDFKYDYDKKIFILDIETCALAQMIEFCYLYDNPLDFHFIGDEPFFEKFQMRISSKNALIDDIFIYPNGGDFIKNENYVEQTFNNIYEICEEFVNFTIKYSAGKIK